MGHGLHGLCLQGQEPACLPLVPVFFPVLGDLPDLLQRVQLLWGPDQTGDRVRRLLPSFSLINTSSHPQEIFPPGNAELNPHQFTLFPPLSCFKSSSRNKHLKRSSMPLVSRDMQIKTTGRYFTSTRMTRAKNTGRSVDKDVEK